MAGKIQDGIPNLLGGQTPHIKPPQQIIIRIRLQSGGLAAEEIRDSILNLTGQLNLKMAGPSIYTEIPAEVARTASRPGAAWGRSSKEDAARRSVYIFVKRSLHEPFLASFDWADTDNTCDVRFVTTVPTPWLDDKHTVFGRVTHGMEVCQAIENVKCNRFDKPHEDVAIIAVEIHDAAAA